MATDPITGEPIPGTVIVLFAVLLVACLAVSIVIMRRLTQGEPLVAYSPRRIVPWNVWHLLATFALYIGAMAASFWGFATIFQVQLPLELVDVDAMTVTLCAQLTASLLALLGFMLIAQPRWSDMGLSGADSDRDLVVGLGAFVVLGPWLYGLNMLLAYFHDGRHPLIEAFEKSGDRDLLLLATVSAVLVAPVVEEFIFRVLLQGWLERVLAPAGSVPAAGERSRKLDSEGGESAAPTSAPPDFSSEGTSDGNPFAAPDDRVTAAMGERWETPTAAEPPLAARKVFWSPIIISSIAFSLVHLGHGPAPVPLFFLALVLGYLYQRTHRVLPCIVSHMALNAFSMGILWLFPI